MSIQKQDLRAVIWPLLNPDTGLMHCHQFLWQDLECEAGIYSFEAIHRALDRAMSIQRYALLRIEPTPPGWCTQPVEDFLRLLGALGKAVGDQRVILGIDVLCPGAEEDRTRAELAAIADAYCRGFPEALKYVHAGSAMEGMLKDCKQKGILVTPETVRQYENCWQSLPLRMLVDPAQPDELQQAIDHHVSILEASNEAEAHGATHAGHRFQLQSVQLNDGLKENHQVEATITFANAGTLPCYIEARFCIRLSGSDVDCTRVFPLPLRAFDVKPGDQITITQTLDTGGMQPGEYDVQAGLFCEGTGYPISLGVEGRISDGYYEGRLILTLKG